MPITEQHTEETLCLAHIYALAGVAGVNYEVNAYDYGVDGTFKEVITRGTRRVDSGFPLDFQAKATINWERVDDNIVYDLEAKTYNDIVLRSTAETTMVLILLCLPKNRSEWNGTSCEQTILRHCCYWHILTGEPTSNTDTKRIFIPINHLLTPDTLTGLMLLERNRREAQTA